MAGRRTHGSITHIDLRVINQVTPAGTWNVEAVILLVHSGLPAWSI